jgi:hypothetical protein
MHGDSESTPRCVNCGYDLRGLPLPRRCPECGHLSGLDAERKEAESWYASWRGLLFLFPPPLAMAHLHYPRSRGVALRRLFYGFALPWIVLSGFIASASSIVFVSTYERWWESVNSRGVRHDVDSTTSEHRLFGDPEEFGGFHEPRSTVPTKIYRTAWVRTAIRLTAPRPDARLITLTFSVFLSSGLCLATAHLLMLVAIGFGHRVNHPGLSSRAALSATACLIPVNALALVGLVVLLASRQWVYSYDAERVATALVIGLMLALAWGVALLIRVGAAVLAHQSGLRFLFGALLGAVWLFAAGAALFVLVAPFLVPARY